jgi:hypothetical protein
MGRSSCTENQQFVASASLDSVAHTTNSTTPAAAEDSSIEDLLRDDPFGAFLVDSTPIAPATKLRRIPLWLGNTFPSEVVVQAEAGIGRVVVDTVASGDSVRVDLETRADSVRLTAVTLAGRRVGERVVRPGKGLQRLVFP